MFVGDSIEADIVGGNRVGMRTALLSSREFVVGDAVTQDPLTQDPLTQDPLTQDPLTHPDHRLTGLRDVIDLVVPGAA